MTLSVIIPAYNEAKTLPAILEKVMEVPLEKEIILVDDGSTDNTPQILEQYKEREGFTLLRHSSNEGKGMAVRTGLSHAAGKIVIIQDTDLEYDPRDYEKLVEPIRNGEERVVYGTRTRPGAPCSYRLFYWGGRLVSLFTNILYHQMLTDVPTCYKAFDAGLLKSVPLKCKGFDFDPEITARIAGRGIRIREIPIRYYPRTFREGKKIRWTDGLIAFWVLLRYRFAP